jgi:hypothetical protein
VLGVPSQSKPRAVRMSRKNKGQAIRRLKKVATELLPEIDNILRRHHGKRLTEDVDALGTIYIETTPAGLFAVAECDKVKAVLEDQEISLLSSLNRKARKSESV